MLIAFFSFPLQQKYLLMKALLQFSVANFRSIYTRRTISFKASSIKDEPRDNVISYDRVKYLRTAAVYGANSSGKSNLLMAMGSMRFMIEESAKLNDGEELKYEPFILSTTSETKPTLFEACFVIDNNKYRYGFEFNESCILSEWLYKSTTKSAKETTLFVRTEDGIGINEEVFSEAIGLENKTNKNRLFVSLVSQLSEEMSVSKQVMSFFRDFNVISGLHDRGYHNITREIFLENTDEANHVVKLFRDLQLGFDEVVAEEERKDDNKKEIKVYTKHLIYNKKGKIKDHFFINMEYMESAGTKKLFDLAGPIIDTLLNGKVLVVDELDAKMHPLISQHLVNIFNNPDKNNKNAQLIFSTHDTHLLSSAVLRRDQIWFTEKNECEETDVYSIMDILLPDGSKPRSDSNLEKNYILGRYGAIPYIMND